MVDKEELRGEQATKEDARKAKDLIGPLLNDRMSALWFINQLDIAVEAFKSGNYHVAAIAIGEMRQGLVENMHRGETYGG